MAYNVAIGNWSQYVKDAINNQEVSNYIIGSNGGGDPAYGCYKNFTATYQCGNGPNKSVNISGYQVEAGGRNVNFDCSAENKICGGFRLTVGDDGNLVLTDSNSAIVWQSNTRTTGLALDEYKASNGKYGRNYLLAGETLKTGEFVGSPSGNCYLMMVGNKADCTQNGLQLLYTKINCTMNSKNDGYGNDETANGLYSMKKTDISKLGKVGYVDEQNNMHHYPDDMTSLAQTYTLIGNYDSVGYDIAQIQATSIETCKTSCNGNADCAGFVYDNTTCKLKNAGMFPKGLRVPSASSALYLREKAVTNDLSCTKDIDDSVASEWELYPTSADMTATTLCNLGAITQEQRADAIKRGDELNQATDIMGNNLNSIATEKNNIKNTITNSAKQLKNNIKDYEVMRKKILNNNKTIKNIIGMAEDTDLNMTSQNMKYFLFANLAIILAIAGIKLMRN